MTFLELFDRRLEVERVLLEDFAQFAQVLHNQIRFRHP